MKRRGFLKIAALGSAATALGVRPIRAASSPEIIAIYEGDSIAATVISSTLAASLGTSARIAWPWKMAGLTPDQVPGSSGFFSYAPFWWPYYNGNVLCINRAIGASRLQTNQALGDGSGTNQNNYPGDLSFRASTWINPLIASQSYTRPMRKHILFFCIGANPDTDDPNQHATNVANYISTMKSNGIDKVILGTLISRSDGIIGSVDSNTFDTTYAQPFNTLVRNGITGVDGIADFASDSRLGATLASQNTTYFVDKIHPTDAGYSIMSPIAQAALNAVVKSLSQK